jgi:cytoskeletal protein CcmA (bactofilin family)
MSVGLSIPRPGDAEAATLVGAGARFEGLLSFRGVARVDGELHGEIHAAGRLLIGPRARVKARVEVDELVVAGELEGDIRARQRAELQASGRITGSLETLRVAVADGGILQVRLRMERPGERAPEAAADASPSS